MSEYADEELLFFFVGIICIVINKSATQNVSLVKDVDI